MKIFVLDFNKNNDPIVCIIDKHKLLIKGVYSFKKNIFYVDKSNIKTKTQFNHVYDLLTERDWGDKIVFICKKFKTE